MTKLTKSINKLTHDRHRNDSHDDRHNRHDGHKSRYCDGHREKRDRDYEDYGTYRKNIDLPVDRYPNCPDTQIEEQMDEIVQSSVNILKNVNKLLNK